MEKEKNENQLSVVNQVVKDNRMIESIYHLNAMEQKLILSLCSKISSTDNSFNNFEMTVSEFANFLGIENKNGALNTLLKKKCEELAGKTITMNKGTKKNPNWYIFSWFHHIQYESGKGIISMRFHEDLEPFLLNIQNTYTKYRIGYVMNFQNEYSFRVYELMKEYEKIGERTLSIQDIKQYLFLDKEQKYKKYSHFKSNVIIKSLNEINKYSDIIVSIEKEEKIGKKVDGIVFRIKTNNIVYPIDKYADFKAISNKTKIEVQKLLDSIIFKKYKINMSIIKTDLFVKEAIVQLYYELKYGEYDKTEIKLPIPYFTQVLINKHQSMTGETISKTQLSKYEISKIMENDE